MCAKNYENWLAVDKVMAKISRLTFFGPRCIITKQQQQQPKNKNTSRNNNNLNN